MSNGQVIGIVAGALMLGAVIGKVSSPGRPSEPQPQQRLQPRQPPEQKPAARAPLKPAQGQRREVTVAAHDASAGPASAKVTIVEFSDFQCPYCSRAANTMSQIKREYGDRVRLVFKHHPLAFHKDAPLAHQAAVEAHRQGRFWEYHDRLFADQRNLGRPGLEAHAEALGLDMAKFRRALDGNEHAAQVQRDKDLALSLGARGTPAFFINGRFLSGAQPIEKFREIIDEELRR